MALHRYSLTSPGTATILASERQQGTWATVGTRLDTGESYFVSIYNTAQYTNFIA
ncbi:MAG: hypothetical protein IID37_14735 [Planctomycetes bacterium]|nr:hypothetical protein [Planctomycetota bacterium]